MASADEPEPLASREPTVEDLRDLEKDAGDLAFLRQWFAERGERLPTLDD
jgi:hypothetical protein